MKAGFGTFTVAVNDVPIIFTKPTLSSVLNIPVTLTKMDIRTLSEPVPLSEFANEFSITIVSCMSGIIQFIALAIPTLVSSSYTISSRTESLGSITITSMF